jgi:hypothetical protein
MSAALPEFLRYSWPHRLFCACRDRREVRAWEARGRTGVAPHAVKRAAVLEYARRFGLTTLVETGTFRGEMVWGCRDRFAAIYSIELDPALCRAAQAHFARFPHLHILEGDSEKALPALLPRLSERCLFWLDAHYCGPAAGRAAEETPIVKELEAIFAHPVREHVILVDDARCFGTRPGYPTVDGLREFVARHRPDWTFEVRDDMVRISAAR